VKKGICIGNIFDLRVWFAIFVETTTNRIMYYFKRLQEANKMRDYWGDRKFKFHQKTLGDRFIQKRKEEGAKNIENVTDNQE
jgi:hypothetical protein